MKKPGLFLPLLFAALLGSCNPDVFIDSCAPATDQLQVPADGTAATLRFGSGNLYDPQGYSLTTTVRDVNIQQ